MKKSLINQEKKKNQENNVEEMNFDLSRKNAWLIKKMSWLTKKIMSGKQKIHIGGNERIIYYNTYTLPYPTDQIAGF